jgi:hypothetical protein
MAYCIRFWREARNGPSGSRERLEMAHPVLARGYKWPVRFSRERLEMGRIRSFSREEVRNSASGESERFDVAHQEKNALCLTSGRDCNATLCPRCVSA